MLSLLSLATLLPALTSAASPPATMPAGDIGQFVRLVGTDLDTFWQPVLKGAAPGLARPYRGPAGMKGYAAGDVPDTPCSFGTGPDFWRSNAHYCDQDGTIWYDETWFADISQSAGGYAPAAIISHEWGHHLQTLLSRPSRDIGVELQADCFAGMYLSAAEQSDPFGDGQFLLRDADLLAALGTFYSLGDTTYRASDWFQPSTHGSSHERFVAFATGYTTGSGDIESYGRLVNGLDWCLGYAGFRPSAYTPIGPYRLLDPPGRPGTWQGDVYTIPSPDHPASATSDLRMRWAPARSGPSASPNEDALAAALDDWLPGARLLFGPNDLYVAAGDGVADYYEWLGGGSVESGYAALLVPKSGTGGLLVLASRPQAAPCCADAAPDPTTLATALEQMLAVGQVAARLCAPDASTDPQQGSFQAICLTELQ